jgi:hypothetical protein
MTRRARKEKALDRIKAKEKGKSLMKRKRSRGQKEP